MNMIPIRQFALAATLAATSLLVSCAPSVDLPKGNSRGYQSARLVQRNPDLPAPSGDTAPSVHRMIQQSIAKQFTQHGLAYGSGNADLTVAYLVIYQEPGMTTRFEEYFGFGRSADQIADVAHTRGAIENQRPDFFRRAGIVVDVIDSRSHKLIYRDFAAGDVVRAASNSTRAARIDAAITQALAKFFAKS